MRKAAFTITLDDLALFTDFYELTMLQSYFDAGMSGEAVFSLFVRRLPKERNYLLSCGLADVIEGLESLHFSDEALAYLRSLGKFSDDFVNWLAEFRFQGDVYAVAEGTPIFANEPILEIAAPIGQAQLVETFVMNQCHFQTLLASKAARVVEAAQGRVVIDFGARRMHGLDAALKAARAFHIAGVNGTSNVLAGERYAIPVTGTMAHSYIQAFDSEYDAFATFAKSFPKTILLVDTYDTIEGVRQVIELSRELGEEFKVRGVRLDSGDLASLAKETRKLLDAAGLESVGIIASSGLDEYTIADLLSSGAPVTGFGVGTAMGVSEDVPALDIAYKLSSYEGAGRLKLSPGKEIYPGRKQVFRIEREGKIVRDVIARSDEVLPGKALLQPVMRGGKRVPDLTANLNEIRDFACSEIYRLPEAIRGIEPVLEPYPVQVSDKLEAYRREVIENLKQSRTDAISA